MTPLPPSPIFRSVPIRSRQLRFGRRRAMPLPRLRISDDVKFFLLAWSGGFIFFFTILH